MVQINMAVHLRTRGWVECTKSTGGAEVRRTILEQSVFTFVVHFINSGDFSMDVFELLLGNILKNLLEF